MTEILTSDATSAPISGIPDRSIHIITPLAHRAAERNRADPSSALPLGVLERGVELGFNANSRALVTTHLFLTATWLMMLPYLFGGRHAALLPSFDCGGFLELLSVPRITIRSSVPSQYIHGA